MTAITTDEGRFGMTRLPAADSYALRANHRLGFGAARATFDDAGNKDVVIVIEPVLYESYLFEDADGSPVDVAGWHLHRHDDYSPFHSSCEYSPDPDHCWALERAGIPMRYPPNAFVVFAHGIGASPEGGWRPRRIEIPGFQPVDVERSVRPLSDWPAATVVRLSVARLPPATTSYRVAFPEVPTPDEWRLEGGPIPEFWMWLRWADGRPGGQLTPRSYRFVGPSDAKFELQPFYALPSSDQRVEFGLETVGTEVVVRPRLPALGYVSLRYRSIEPRRPRGFGLQINGRSDLGPIVVWPGYARIGPLPPGLHTIVRKWRGGLSVDRSDVLQFEIDGPHRQFAWE